MVGSSIASAARGVAIAVAAGELATTRDTAGAAIQDRYETLKRAISRRSAKISVGDLVSEPTAEAPRTALAKALEEHGVSKSRDVITVAKELLALIKGDEDARAAVGALLTDVEQTLVDLADVEGEDDAPADVLPDARPSSRSAPRSSARALGSQRFIPADEPSKTELERSILPIWKRTDRFFLKVGVVIFVYVAAAATYFLFIRTPSNEALERCRKGDRGGCWLVVATEDTIADGEKISTEPLTTLCDQHHDPCGCIGLAYVTSATSTNNSECDLIKQAMEGDPKSACSCTRYKFWRGGQQRTLHCGVPKCE